ncbi:MAG: SDR family oxidoreductase [Firmicutes bacterium]|nr:SDR family oxidoreductase [Bacillota bacterium]
MDKVWMITGAARGLGKAFVEEAVKQKDKVIAAVRKIPDDELFKNENVLPVIMDVTNTKEIETAVKSGFEKFGKIDFLINNAGFGMNGAFEEISDKELRHLFETDYFGVVNVTKAVLPIMRAQKSGKILNISSQAGLVGGAGCTAYNAAKFAVVGLSEGLNDELACFNIQVIAVCPGAFRTDFRDDSSIHRPEQPMPEYDDMAAHNVVDWLKEHNHQQQGDPAKAAAFVYKTVTGDNVPQILTIGKDCTDVAITAYKEILGEMASYYDETSKTAYESEGI